MKKRVAALLLLLLTVSPLFAFPKKKFSLDKLSTRKTSDQINSEKIARLEKEIPRLMKEAFVPGLSIALIDRGKVSWQHNFGTSNAETNEPVTNDTIFEAASLSKPVFAYAVLKLVDQEKLDLDAPLVKYLPGARVENDERANLITARMVLSHKTGFPNWRPFGQPLKIIFNPGERFSYSGEGFQYLQEVVEHLTNQPLDDFMRKTVFEPLGMTNSSYLWLDKYNTLKVFGHNAAGLPTKRRKPEEANAAATMQTTTSDYAKFLVALLNGAGLKKETYKQMLTAQIAAHENCAICVNNTNPGQLSNALFWGLGVGLQQIGKDKYLWHWGDNGDTHCFFTVSEKEKTGILIFTDSGNGHSIIPAIAETALGVKQPAYAWLKYDSYDAPAKTLFRAIYREGAEKALKVYLEERKQPAKRLTEAQINSLGYALMQSKKTADAIEVLKLNVADFPASFNAYDSLGEAYINAGNKELAIQNYQKSLELNPQNQNAVQKLKKLKEQ